MNKAIVDRREESATEERSISTNTWLVAPGVWRLKDLFVNVFIIQDREATGWVLVDAGLSSTAPKIRTLVADLFGRGSLPRAIVMTHAHFDHRGSLIELAEEWGVPVYCHHLERPYLTGRASYPPADPSVGGGAMALLSFTYPKKPINIESRLRELPENGVIEELEDWQWIHTPGHTAGHISLFRDKDGVLIAGDAIVNTMQESLLAVAAQAKILSGPPKYFTPDWLSATQSVKKLAALEPNVIASGHGKAMYGDEARKALHKLVRNFWQQGIPAAGRYVKEATRYDEEGVPVHIPKPSTIMIKKLLISAALFTAAYLIKKHYAKGGRVNSLVANNLSTSLKTISLGALGATAPISPALPSIPLIPAL